MRDQSKQHLSKDQLQKRDNAEILYWKFKLPRAYIFKNCFILTTTSIHYSRMRKSTITNQQDTTLEK